VIKGAKKKGELKNGVGSEVGEKELERKKNQSSVNEEDTAIP